MTDARTATRLLAELARGAPDAAEQLLPLVYEQLHGLARNHFRRQPAAHTLQPTALVNEAYLRLIDKADAGYRGRSHFMAVAATAMRQILIDHARRKRAVKHGGGLQRIALDDAEIPADEREVDLIALDAALRRLAEMDERKSQVVALRFFGGLGIDQVAEALGVARSTVTEDWRFARAWIVRELRDGDN
jgi:RNA polymerase sigma factor (TIGR02999 family)